jgi:hypothetical protein
MTRVEKIVRLLCPIVISTKRSMKAGTNPYCRKRTRRNLFPTELRYKSDSRPFAQTCHTSGLFRYQLTRVSLRFVLHERCKLTEYERRDYCRVTALLHGEKWPVNHKRVERIWRQEALKVPKRQRNAEGCGWPTVHAFGFARVIAIKFGAATSSRTGQRTDGRFGF